ncbi:unnamed protein product [Euphydryas editha]|uniref:THAP-type domain-containing protein n=1 Tax=Euphydryas editha TaxID=104508 RepID=A0AAU9U4A4_EUPED|nr:unnamed protein product [Euphydryas editha]
MPQCVFKNCKNNHRNVKITDGISFFRFPSDPFRFAKWVSIVAKERGEEFYTPCKNSTICSIHFDKLDITGNTQRRRLLKSAIPKLQIHDNTKVQSAILSKLTDDLTNQAQSPISVTLLDATATIDVPLADPVPCESSDASISELISLSDTPRKDYLQQKLTRCRRVIISKSQKIHNLQKVNKRLLKKNASLKNIIKILKKKTIN